MSEAKITLDELAETGAYLKGHFKLSSGIHSSDYLQCALYLRYPKRAERAGRAIAQLVRAQGLAPELVVSPALGGVIIGHETAASLAVPFIFTERADGRMTLRRGFKIAPNTKVLIVEDVVTTGRSTREVMSIVEESGASTICVGAIVNRSGRKNPFNVPFVYLIEAEFPTWEPEACPLCKKGVALEKPGSRPG